MLHKFPTAPDFVILGAFAIALQCPPACAISAESPDRSAKQIVALIEIVLQEHIQPPSRQQLALNGIRAAYAKIGELPPGNLAKRASEVASTDAMRTFFENEQKRWKDKRNQNRTESTKSEQGSGFNANEFLQSVYLGIVQSIPGGAQITPAKEVRVQQSLSANRYVGVGIALSMKGETPQVAKLFAHGPGHKAGMQNEDLILAIDGARTSGKPLGQIVDELRGEEGTNVRLVLQQDGEQERELTVERGVTFIPTVLGIRELSLGEYQYTLSEDPDIAYLRVERIGASTAHELKQIESRLRKRNISGLVLDLRSGGGSLHDTTLVADLLLENCTIGYTVSQRERVEHKCSAGLIFRDIPVAVLVGNRMGDDRVFLAACLQDHGRATLIGPAVARPAFVRRQFPLPNGDAITMATGYLQRSDGSALLTQGLLDRGNSSGESRLLIPDLLLAQDDSSPITEFNGVLRESAIEALRNRDVKVNDGAGEVGEGAAHD